MNGTSRGTTSGQTSMWKKSCSTSKVRRGPGMNQVDVHRLLLVLLLAAGNLRASTPEGIPRELARGRARQISDVSYPLSYVLTPHAPSVSGHEWIVFRLAAPAAPVVLDCRTGPTRHLTSNGAHAIF